MTRLVFTLLLLLSLVADTFAQERKRPGPANTRNALPQDHPYQRTLRDFLATLTEKDFTHGVTEELSIKPTGDDLDYNYRQHVFTLMPQPLVGTKRGIPAVNAPAKLFLLASIEQPQAVMVPPVWPETLMSFVQWKYPGNPYFNNRALKLRSFVTASVMMLMLDDQIDNRPELGGSRADWLSYQLVVLGGPYPGFKDLLPGEVQRAYETLLRKMGQRILDWGPKGEEPNLDIITTLGLWYASKALNDPVFGKQVETYSRGFFTDPRHFHPAGYFIDQRGIDMGYQGTTNYFAGGVALASGWPFARDAVEKCYRLRAHLCLPEPDGTFVGPSHFNSRTSSDAWKDQWEWGGARDAAAALVTNEALYLVKMPTLDELRAAPGKRAQGFSGQLRENPVDGKGGFLKNDDLTGYPWKWRLWHSFNFPASVNFGYEFYPAGAYPRRAQLEKEGSPWLKSPFARQENFLRDFEKAFTVGKYPGYAAIVHSGPVGSPGGENGLFKFSGPLGFGGGQLSAFWTPATGCVLLGRRGGNSWDKTFDLLDEWRTWPIHAVSGATHAGKVFTSGRIAQPEVASEIDKDRGTVVVRGTIPVEQLGQGKVLEGRIGYSRTFQIAPDAVLIETKVTSSGQDKLAEFHESLPVFLQEAGSQPKAVPTVIEFQIDGKWAPATAEYRDRVTAVKLTRFTGAVQVAFDRPRRVKLSPAVWKDTYLSRATCRNVLIDLLEGATGPVVLRGETTVGYTISAIAP